MRPQERRRRTPCRSTSTTRAGERDRLADDRAAERQAGPGRDDDRDADERDEDADQLRRREDVGPGDDREERDEDRRRGDDQRRVAGRDGRQAGRPQDLVDARTRAPPRPHIATRSRRGSPIDPSRQRSSTSSVTDASSEPQEREADRRQDRERPT